MANRVAVRNQIRIAGRIDRAAGKRIRQKLLLGSRAFATRVSHVHLQRRGEGHAEPRAASSASNRCGSPDRRRTSWRWWFPAVESVGQGQWRFGRIRHPQALRERRLLRHLHRDRLIHRRVVVNAVAAADHHRRSGQGPPRERDAGRSCCDPDGAASNLVAIDSKPGAMSRFTRRPYFSCTGDQYSQRTPALTVSPGLIRQSSLTNASLIVARRYLSALPKAMELVSGTPSRNPAEVVAGRRAGEGEGASRILLRQHIELLPAMYAAVSRVVAARLMKASTLSAPV